MNQVDLNTAFDAEVLAKRNLRTAAQAWADAHADYDIKEAGHIADGLSGGNDMVRKANLAIAMEAQTAALAVIDQKYEEAKLTAEIAAINTSRVRWSIRLAILQSADPTLGGGE